MVIYQQELVTLTLTLPAQYPTPRASGAGSKAPSVECPQPTATLSLSLTPSLSLGGKAPSVEALLNRVLAKETPHADGLRLRVPPDPTDRLLK